ncbi:DinB superfamily protein [Salinibacillus kushneri]|uniref:DinB superfamily protein n=1 Tax=Salinibacillus kushneri TaxID=237682 RepID=A0A1I0JKP1_9BACI|nr:DinB family protein [Salinibacillus kushneri]SEU10102.1 DinB superfamily protein [Salinibacillus kushneri]
MSSLVISQINIAYKGFMNEIKDVSDEQLTKQPEGFNNNILWHIGHVLTTNEQFLFGFPDNTDHLPKQYKDLFGYGTKPAEWPDDVPTADELADKLNKQIKRIKQIPLEKFEEKLPEVTLGAQTFGELAALAAFHIANHAGRVNAMKKVLNK